jgi:hypothetical protein
MEFKYFSRYFFVHLQTELSHNLQQLSEKARSTTEFIQRLKGMSDKVTVSFILFYLCPHCSRPMVHQGIMLYGFYEHIWRHAVVRHRNV